MIDKKALHSITYGLYVISSRDEKSDKASGCIANTFQQVTSEPPRVSVALNKDNYTAQIIQESGVFAATILAQNAPMELIGLFGFRSGKDVDKFAEVLHATDEQGVPFCTEDMVARFSVTVLDTVDVGSHVIFVGDVMESERLVDAEPLTYTYYHQIKGGKTPPKASSYQADEEKDADDVPASSEARSSDEATPRTSWRCAICGYIEIAEELPDDFKCPLCGQGREVFDLGSK